MSKTSILFTKKIDPERFFLDRDRFVFECESFIKIQLLNSTSKQIDISISDHIITSENALYFIEKNNICGHFYCVGEKLAKLLESKGKKVVMCTENATSLAELIVEVELKRLNFFCGNIRLDNLPDILKNNNILVEEHICYNTTFFSKIIKPAFDAYVFFSPSGVKSFFINNKTHKNAIVFALGETTRTALEKVGIAKVFLPESANFDSLQKTITKYYAKE